MPTIFFISYHWVLKTVLPYLKIFRKNYPQWFDKCVFPYLLLLPQLVITLMFFIWPAIQAIRQSFYQESPFGFSSHFVAFKNYISLFSNSDYLHSVLSSFIVGIATTVLSMVIALLLAVVADRLLKKRKGLQSVLVWPYAVAPAVAGLLWMFMLNPSVGILAHGLQRIGIPWNSLINSNDAILLIVIAGAWKQISYNFLFFLAGLQSIPSSLLEAAAIDGAGPIKRFWNITFPLLSPTSFFLLIVNLVYAFCDTFSIIDAVTQGGPGNSTTTMVYKIFLDGFKGESYGSSSAQSVILMIVVTILVVIQFRFVERKVVY